uniref:Uncharacterized protein n=1 Tax=Timema cristinae TaxID=61476 RepID=A0A7R9CBK6_TIMCR|nr:unnamed protein product [Timema cristinae]
MQAIKLKGAPDPCAHQYKHTLTGHSNKVMAAKFLGEPTKVVTGSYDRTLKIWDLRSRASPVTKGINTKFAGSSCNDLVTSDGSGSTIISGHFDKTIRFWDMRADSHINEISLQGKVTSLDLSREGGGEVEPQVPPPPSGYGLTVIIIISGNKSVHLQLALNRDANLRIPETRKKLHRLKYTRYTTRHTNDEHPSENRGETDVPRTAHYKAHQRRTSIQKLIRSTHSTLQGTLTTYIHPRTEVKQTFHARNTLQGTPTTYIYPRTEVKKTFHVRHTTRHSNDVHPSENRALLKYQQTPDSALRDPMVQSLSQVNVKSATNYSHAQKDSNYLLSCVRDDTLKVLDLRMNQVLRTYSAEGFKVGCDWSRAAFSPDGHYVSVGSSDGAVFIWNVTGKVESILKEHSSAVTAVSWHPYSSYLVSVDKSRRVVVWGDV